MIIGIIGSGGRERAICAKILESKKVKKTGHEDQDTKNITLKINQILEKMIIKNPKQWIWSHNRWK